MTTTPDHTTTYEQPAVTIRYLLTAGRIIDINTRTPGSSHERSFVLTEAARLWGKKAPDPAGGIQDWKIEGTTQLIDNGQLDLEATP